MAAQGPDEGVAEHYGDPLGEQRALVQDVAWVDRSHREVLAVRGPERLSWLHTLLSQHVSGLADGQGTEGLVLDPHGRVEHDLQLAALGDTVWVDVEPGTGAALFAYLTRMRFWAEVELAEEPRAVLTLAGPGTEAVLAQAGLAAPDAPPAPPAGGLADPPVPVTDAWGAGGAVVRRRTWPGPDAVDVLVARADLPALADRLTAAGAVPAGTWAWEALRVAARVPRLGRETDARTIPHEVGWIGSAVHLHKGCYRGQETVARVQNLGRPPRRLVLLQLDGSDDVLPASGDAVVAEGRTVGTVGTAARHFELGPIALAVLKRQVPDDATLTISGPSGGSVAAAIDPVG